MSKNDALDMVLKNEKDSSNLKLLYAACVPEWEGIDDIEPAAAVELNRIIRGKFSNRLGFFEYMGYDEIYEPDYEKILKWTAAEYGISAIPKRDMWSLDEVESVEKKIVQCFLQEMLGMLVVDEQALHPIAEDELNRLCREGKITLDECRYFCNLLLCCPNLANAFASQRGGDYLAGIFAIITCKLGLKVKFPAISSWTVMGLPIMPPNPFNPFNPFSDPAEACKKAKERFLNTLPIVLIAGLRQKQIYEDL